ncbi:MAG TPA: ABC transporter substrate-binding protein [Desulfotomaculum sp.]|nr:ABC transporter substrate-binding protein [Desulfotomaculum sp.]
MIFRKIPLLLAATLFSATILIAGCGQSKQVPTESSTKKDSGELVIYSGRKEPLIKPVIEEFEKATGVKVTLRSGGASELANAIIEEGNTPKGDVFIANDAGTLENLRGKGLLAPNKSEIVAGIPLQYRSEDGSWVGVSGRARVIMYNTNLVKESELPKSVFELTDPKWKKQVALSISSNESLIGHITAIRHAKGEKEAENWMKGLMANQAQFLKGHTEVRKAVGSGEFKLGVVNHYYYHLEKKDGSPVAVIYPDQDPGQMGVPMNIAGAGIIKGAKNQESAAKFIDFLLQPKAQELFAKLNYEMPVVDGVPVNEAKALKDFKKTDVNLQQLGQELGKTIDLVEKVGLP